MEEQNANVTVSSDVTMETGATQPQENINAEPTENQTNAPADAVTAEPQPTEPVEQVEQNTVQDTPNVGEDINALKQKLQEYQMREEEIKNLSSRLGTDKVQDVQIAQAHQQMDIINNQAQQAYIKLCNEYGVDYRPDKIDASSLELKEKDPQRYYELVNRIEHLDNLVTNKRNEVNSYIYQKELSNALAQYQSVMDASPALSGAITNYLRNNYGVNPNQAIQAFMDLATPVYKEAFEYGRLYAQQEAVKAQNNPSETLNDNIAMKNASYASTNPRPFTLAEIDAMSQAEFEKNEAEIDRQFKAGLIK